MLRSKHDSVRGRKQVSNDDLARMIAEGFADTATKSDLQKVEDRLSGRIDGVEVTLEGVETRLRGVETKIDRALYSEITHLDQRVKRLEKKTGLTE